MSGEAALELLGDHVIDVECCPCLLPMRGRTGPILSATEAAEAAGVSRTTIRRYLDPSPIASSPRAKGALRAPRVRGGHHRRVGPLGQLCVACYQIGATSGPFLPLTTSGPFLPLTSHHLRAVLATNYLRAVLATN
jgi:hypothetical protein